MKKILIIAIISIIGSANALAQGPETLLLPDNAVSTAMGGVRQAIETHDNTFGVNANLSMWAPKMMNSKVFGLKAYYCVSPSFELNLEGGMVNGLPYEMSDELGGYSESFTPRDFAAKLGASYKLAAGLSFGAKVTYLRSSLAKETGLNTFGIDAAVQYRKNGLKAEIGACNLASPVALGKADVSYSIAGFTAAAEFDYLFKGGMMAGVGAEYTIAKIASIRAGYHYGNEEKAIPSYVSAGLGFKFAGVHIDAAYIIYKAPLAGTISASLGYSF